MPSKENAASKESLDRMPDTSAENFIHHSEGQEREAAWERAAAYRQGSAAGVEAQAIKEKARQDNPAFAALAENVRDYAVFLLSPAGTIIFWGKAAHLLKWWTDVEAEGAHLRLLYPEGGSEDGTAEAHLRQAAETGEYSGEGQRVRADQSTFWAHVTLTALRDPQGNLIGFAKVTRDMTARRATEAALARAQATQTALEKALAQVAEARAKLDRVQEESAFAREHSQGAREYIAQVLDPILEELDPILKDVRRTAETSFPAKNEPPKPDEAAQGRPRPEAAPMSTQGPGAATERKT